MPDPRPGFDELLDRYLAGTLTENGAARLLSLLESHPDLGAELLDQFAVDAKLRDLAGGTAPVVPAAPTVAARAGRTARRLPWLVTGVAVAASVAVAVFRIAPPTGGPLPVAAAEEPTTAAVAVLTRTVGAKWDHPTGGPTVGAALEPGWLKLSGGLAEVEFFSGARVVLEGPAEFRLVAADEAFCKSGKLTAEVPPHAAGFRVGTPQGALVDRGTAFGLSVTPGGAEVHVFQGKVELHGAAGQRDLTTGEAMAVAGNAPEQRIPADATGFVTSPDLDRREATAAAQERGRWAAAAKGWNADPALLVRFDFEGPNAGRSLANAATNGSAVGAGTVVGCERAEGHWPGKGALEFGRVADRVRFAYPGEVRSLTLLARVRVGGLDRTFNSLMMSDAFAPGAVHWQVLSDGRVRLGVAARPRHTDYDSPRVFTPNTLGQWVHLAVVYDADARRVTHYADGVPLSRADVRAEVPLKPGRAELGNWNAATRSDNVPVRHFSGRMDEFAAYSRPLTDDEVRRHAAGH
ncbi:LamG domain protein jellyroll fold domain protein OS=Chthoniobacter flavus Ellin428 GN=CfE428DRAFT_4331 PE=4 SV=1: FecR: Laminin_G_3 [Gemmataceae bacterium]|nr:LamG domain protein jellyroll fold domain protein OS=Chthoniobacter flavus Ellin428 GN=CfE428DRAFT_4331 PE=4 SV=1: FecR: Laminin_G_3 [Gemmataceae bacterium]VTT98642.1 LamG domain protein jellyroll fold domain protein OS=Chthoniobacter flavus Ellin428 GN=CfE428DRAFT_4331 PE=4 SV=1: FecR: Laminin_G_3 [Gemmataceae bacterium]